MYKMNRDKCCLKNKWSKKYIKSILFQFRLLGFFSQLKEEKGAGTKKTREKKVKIE